MNLYRFLPIALAAVAFMIHPARGGDGVTEAVAVLQPTEGSEVTGVVHFMKHGDAIHMKGEIKGLTPGKHGFHVHEFGDITSTDGKSAGGHFNPGGAPHAGPDAEMRHEGDLGNVVANNEGVAKIDVMDPKLSFEGEKSILGRSLVVHAGEDDLKSQPSGDAGGRAACGVIGVAKAADPAAKSE